MEGGLHHGEEASLIRDGGVAPINEAGSAVFFEIRDGIIEVVLLKILSRVQQKHQGAEGVARGTARVVPLQLCC